MILMNRASIFFCVLLVIIFSAGDLWGFSKKPAEPEYVPGKIMVKFREDISEERIKTIVTKENGTIESALKSSRIHIIDIPENADVLDAVNRFSAYPEVVYAEPSYRATPLEEK